MSLIAAIAEAYGWHRSLGNQILEGRHARYVVNLQTPDVWMTNHIQSPRAASSDQIDELLSEADSVFAHCSHRLVFLDHLAPPVLEARLRADGYGELDPTIQMLLSGRLPQSPRPDGLLFTSVMSAEDWDLVYQLMKTDHAEGKRSFGLDLEDHVTRGLIADMRRKSGPSTVYLAWVEGVPVAYGAGVDCPNGMGLIEDLFTLPAKRGQGIATSLIGHAIANLRKSDPDRPIFLGALANQEAKHLYRRMGFEPVMLTRELIYNP